MNNSNINRAFLICTDAKVKNQILTNIANHYGITTQEAFEEVTNSEAEHLLDYLTGNIRSAVSLLMQKLKMSK